MFCRDISCGLNSKCRYRVLSLRGGGIVAGGVIGSE